MIKDDTLLILGAGSSMDYKFPSGIKLLDDIHNIHSGDLKLFPNKDEVQKKFIALFLSANDNFSKPYEDYFSKIDDFFRLFENASPASIDDFLGRLPPSREDLKFIGKFLITYLISNHEFSENLAIEPLEEKQYRIPFRNININQKKAIHGWYSYLWKKIYEDCFPQEIKADTVSELSAILQKIKIITFNYDRSLEYFLSTRIRNMYHLDKDQTNTIMSNLYIHHVYGKIGSLTQEKDTEINDYKPIQLNEISTELFDDFAGEPPQIEEFKNLNLKIKIPKEQTPVFNRFRSQLNNDTLMNMDINNEFLVCKNIQSYQELLDINRLYLNSRCHNSSYLSTAEDQCIKALIKLVKLDFAKREISRITKIVNGLKTYTEEAIKIDPHIANSQFLNIKNIFFLGFAYHKQNMQWLNLNVLKYITLANAYGTTYKFKKRQYEILVDQLQQYSAGKVNYHNGFNKEYRGISDLDIKEYFLAEKEIEAEVRTFYSGIV